MLGWGSVWTAAIVGARLAVLAPPIEYNLGMKLPSRSDLSWCAWLVILACSIFLWGHRLIAELSDWARLPVAIPMLLLATVALGAGIGAPFKRKRLGMLGGVCLFVAMAALILSQTR